MTEEEKEAIYQRTLRRRWIFLRAAAAVCIGLLAFLLVRCHARPLYSEREIRQILKERYGEDFTLQRLPEEGDGRLYRAASDAWPGLECTVRDVWYDGYWDSLFPIWHFPCHAVADTLRAAAWNRYAVPILAEYGLVGVEAGPEWQFNSFNVDGGAVVDWGTDLDGLAAELTEAVARIQAVPVFSELLERGEKIRYWCVPVLLSAGEGFQVRGTFDLDVRWTEEAVREQLGEMEKKLEGRLERAA